MSQRAATQPDTRRRVYARLPAGDTQTDTLTDILAALAVYRVATDLAWEDGPADLYGRLRGLALARCQGRWAWIARGLCCPICLSFWLSLPAAVAWGPLAWLGIAGAAALLVRLRP